MRWREAGIVQLKCLSIDWLLGNPLSFAYRRYLNDAARFSDLWTAQIDVDERDVTRCHHVRPRRL